MLIWIRLGSMVWRWDVEGVFGKGGSVGEGF